jgi:hypothetical protein
MTQQHTSALFPDRHIPKPQQINFVVGTKMVDEQKFYLVELDSKFEGRVGDLLEAIDSRTNRRYLMMISDIEYAFSHKEEHAEMLDLLRRRSDKQVDESTFNALCKNQAVCNLLGEIETGQTTENGYRPNKYTTTAIRAKEDIERVLVNGWQSGVRLGSLRIGREKRVNLPVCFSTIGLAGQRFLVVGQTGKGKSTAIRHLLDGHLRQMNSTEEKRSVGFLVDDFKMEYPFDTYNQSGQTVPGLVTTIPDITKKKLVILTCNPDDYQEYKDRVRDVLRTQIPLDSLSLSVFCDLTNLTDPQKNVVRLVEDSEKVSANQFFTDLLAKDKDGMPDTLIWGKRYGSMFYSSKGRTKAREKKDITEEEDIDQNLRDRLGYIRRAAQRLLNMPFTTRNAQAGNCIPKLINYIREGCTVIVDKQRLEDHQRELLTVMLLYHLFRYNQQLASGTKEQRDQMIPVVVTVEEAQYLLSKDKVADPDSIFAKIAFTGRSYQIGLLAITQRPQAIQKELLGQFDGFLVLPLEHANDFRHLAEACPALSGYRNDLASAPVGGGVLAYGTPKQIVPLQIENYGMRKDDHSTTTK